MADDRPVEDSTEALLALRAEFDDFRTTMNTRASRQPTGDIEPTLRSTAKAETLLLNGQTVSRTTYAVLWAWVADNGLVIANMFGNGDGSTTFTVPNFQGRFLVAAGTLGADTYALGAIGGSTLKTTVAEHTHTGSTNSYGHNHGSAGSHNHPGSGALADGTHGGHNSGAVPFPPGSGGGAVAGNGNTNDGNHNHTLSLANDGVHTHTTDNHTHTVTIANAGVTAGVDCRPSFFALNWLIWT